MELGSTEGPCVRKVRRSAASGAKLGAKLLAAGTRVEVARKDQKLKLLNWLDKPAKNSGKSEDSRKNQVNHKKAD